MDSLAHIPASEAKASLLSVADTGRVFWWRGRLFRGVAAGEAPSGAESVLEIAGNQGALARRLAGKIKTVICTDADGYALDKGYRAAGTAIDWAILDPFSHETGRLEIPVEQRLRADAVVALALTHHLVLTQNMALAHVLDVIGRFARRFVLIEFMPAGLHDGNSAPALPAWYHEEWFRAGFARRFDVIERTRLEDNRVLFVGATR